jgi:hypothetical protein
VKLSEAIRAGAKMAPQGFKRFKNPRSGRTCAIGAAVEAVGGNALALSGTYGEVEEVYGFPLRSKIPDGLRPASVPQRCTLGRAIATLNDFARWSREAIAEWVEMVEFEAEREEVEQAELATKEIMEGYCKAIQEREGGYVPGGGS